MRGAVAEQQATVGATDRHLLGRVAQLGERLLYTQNVGGSIPSPTTILEIVVIFVTDGKRHLICIPYSVENLHRMANELSIKRCWFHKDHYDIPKRRQKEIESKCEIISSKEIVKIIRNSGV